MINCLEKQNLFSSLQFRFVPSKGTIVLLEQLSDSIFSAFENNEVVTAVFWVQAKHMILLSAQNLCTDHLLGFLGPFNKYV